MTLLTLLAACDDSPPLTEAAQRGRAIWAVHCTACHAADPKLPGSLGPEVAGASKSLLEARVLRAAYPEGYTPKRDTTLMQPMPHLAADIDDLEAFLAAP